VAELGRQGQAGAEALRVLAGVSTKAQLLVLRRQEQLVVIGNTHLHFHPLCSHIRALQLEHLLAAAHEKVMELQAAAAATEEAEVGFVLCGDLNAQPTTSAGTVSVVWAGAALGSIMLVAPDLCRFTCHA
jgi:hypothetical protein